MEQMNFFHTTKYRAEQTVPETVRTIAAAELLLQALFFILRSQFPFWRAEASLCQLTSVMIVPVAVTAGILAPLCGKFRAPLCAALELVLLVVCGRYGWKNLEAIESGVKGLCGDYLLAWNEYYGTNYVMDYDTRESGRALGFIVLVMVLLSLTLRYVTGARFLMLIPVFLAVVPGMLVDLPASRESFALFFWGTVVLYSGAFEQHRVIFVPVGNKKSKISRVFSHLLSAVLTAGVGLGIVAAAFTLFSAPAAKIPEKTPEFLAFQLELESRLESLAEKVQLPSGRERLDNTTPEFQNETVLTVSADREPSANLYLPEFYGGTYRGGSWRKENRDYRRAASESGIDGDRLGMLMRQMGYEYFSTVWYVGLDPDLDLLQSYTISYEGSRTTSAWLPCFTDLTSLEGSVWVEDEGLVKKKRSTEELSFVVWGGDPLSDMSFDFGNTAESEGKEDAVDWYGGYVREHYVKESGIAAVSALAEKLAAQWQESSLVNNMWAEGMPDNLYRLAMADAVRNLLAETAVYNLYLDEVPAGTDCLQYFLETGREGYCMHFASAGTLILQELGVPARYASGYIVKKNSFAGNRARGYEATVYDRNAHAWTEIYLEDIGWVPAEMTPGYETAAGVLPTDESLQEELLQRHEEKKGQQEEREEPKKEPKKQPVPQKAETEDGSKKETESKAPEKEGVSGGGGEEPGFSRKKAIAAAGTAILSAGCLSLLAYLIYSGMRRYRELLWEEIKGKHNRRAVRRINRRMYRRLIGGILSAGRVRLLSGGGSAGVRRLQLTDAEYEKRLARTWPSVSEKDWAEFLRIAKKAAFAAEPVEAAEAEFCYRIYRTRKKRRGECLRRKKRDRR